MDIKFSAEDLAFRDEVRDFFTQEYDSSITAKLSSAAGTDYKEGIVAWQKKLHAKGWIAPGWPKSMAALTGLRRRSLSMRLSAVWLVFPDVVPFGLKMVAPVIYTFGNEEQKARFLTAYSSKRRLVVSGLF